MRLDLPLSLKCSLLTEKFSGQMPADYQQHPPPALPCPPEAQGPEPQLRWSPRQRAETSVAAAHPRAGARQPADTRTHIWLVHRGYGSRSIGLQGRMWGGMR